MSLNEYREEAINLSISLHQQMRAMSDAADNLTETVDRYKNTLILTEPDILEDYIQLMNRLGHESEKLKEKASAYSTTARRFEVAKEDMKSRLKALMLDNGCISLNAKETSISLRKTKGELLCDESRIPQEYFREKITYSVDKDKVRRAIDAGISVPGAHLVDTYAMHPGIVTDFPLTLIDTPPK